MIMSKHNATQKTYDGSRQVHLVLFKCNIPQCSLFKCSFVYQYQLSSSTGDARL